MRTFGWIGTAAVAMAGGAVLAPGQAGAQGLPPGSYQQTCTVVSIDSGRGTMTASCKEKSTSHGYSVWAYAAFPPLLHAELIPDTKGGWGLNKDFPYADCASPLENHDGKLFCTVDQAKAAARLQAAAVAQTAGAQAAADRQYRLDMLAQFAAATPAMRSASVLVLGRDAGNQELTHLLGIAHSGSHPEFRAAMVQKDFDVGTAAKFLRYYLRQSEGEPYRNGVVEAAFQQVYGRPSTPQEQIGWYGKISAGQAWYATIVGDEQANIPAGAAVREAVAQRVADAGFGRPATPAEIARWRASGQNYGTMIEGVRQQLWAPAGADDLVAAAARALGTLGRPADAESVKAAVAAWRPMRPVYAEMISPAARARLGNGRPAALRR